MIHLALKWTRLASVFCVALILVVAVFIGSLLFSNSGLKVLLIGVQNLVPQLSIGSSEGALYPEFSLKDVTYKDKSLGVDVSADKLTLGIKGHCLLEPAVCLRNVGMKGLKVTLSDPQEPKTTIDKQDSEAVTAIATPIPLYVSRLDLDDIQLNLQGTQLSWKHLSTSATMRGNHLQLGQTDWQQIRLALSKADEASPKSTSTHDPKTAITLPSVQIPLRVSLPHFRVQDFRFEQATPMVVNSLNLSGEAYQHDISISSLSVVAPQGSAHLTGHIQLDQNYPLNLALTSQLKMDPINGQSVAANVSGSLAKLTVSASLQGPVTTEAKATLQALEPQLPFSLKVQQLSTQWPLTGDAQYQVDKANLTASGDLNQYQLALDGAVKGQQIPPISLGVQGIGSLTSIELSELKVDALGGQIRGQASADWKSLANWQAKLDLDDIQPQRYWPQAEGHLSGHVETAGHLTAAGGWKVDLPVLSLDGDIRDYPLHLAGEVSAGDEQGKGQFDVVTKGLTLAHGDNHVEVQGSLAKQWNMDVQLYIPDLVKSLPETQGQLQGTLKFRGKAEQPDIHLAINGEKIAWQKQLSIHQLNVQGRVSPLVKPTLDLALKASNIVYQQHKVTSVQMAVKGTEDQHRIELNVQAPEPKLQTEVAFDGKLVLKPSILWQGNIDHWSIGSDLGMWRLHDKTSLAIDADKQEVSIGAHCWNDGKAAICLDKPTTVGKSGSVALSAHQMDFQQIAMFLPQDTELNGAVDATVAATWAEHKAPLVDVSLTLGKGQVVQQLNAPLTVAWDNAKLNAHLEENSLKAQWQIDLTKNGSLTGQVAIKDVTQAQKEMQGHLTLTPLNLDFLANQFGEYSKVTSNIATDLDFSGDMLHPKVNGHLTVDNIGVHGDISPVDVNSGKVNIEFKDYTAQLSSSITTQEGVLAVTGDANWADLEDWRVNAHVSADSLMIDMPPMVKAKVVPDLSLAMQPKLASVSGKISLPWGRVVVEELPKSAVSVSKDQIILDKHFKPVTEENRFPFDIETAVSIDIGNDFKLKAFGLQAGLTGHLNVSQKDKGPFVTGEINLIDGTYRSFGQDLIIQEGKIVMNGAVDQPNLSITAIRNPDNIEDDVTAGIKVTGSVDEPQVTVFSDPSMPQANALSYLLRGQDIDGEAGGNSMTTALIGLSLAQSGKVVGEIGQAVGVQDLQLDTAGSGDDSQVTVSGYILPGLQVKYGVGIFNSVGEFTVRYRLMKDLYVEAVSGLTSAVDILYQFEFD